MPTSAGRPANRKSSAMGYKPDAAKLPDPPPGTQTVFEMVLPMLEELIAVAKKNGWAWAVSLHDARSLEVIVSGPLSGLMRHHSFITGQQDTWFARDAEVDYMAFLGLPDQEQHRLSFAHFDETLGAVMIPNRNGTMNIDIYAAGERVGHTPEEIAAKRKRDRAKG